MMVSDSGTSRTVGYHRVPSGTVAYRRVPAVDFADGSINLPQRWLQETGFGVQEAPLHGVILVWSPKPDLSLLPSRLFSDKVKPGKELIDSMGVG